MNIFKIMFGSGKLFWWKSFLIECLTLYVTFLEAKNHIFYPNIYKLGCLVMLVHI